MNCGNGKSYNRITSRTGKLALAVGKDDEGTARVLRGRQESGMETICGRG